jgi:hypothetical protein
MREACHCARKSARDRCPNTSLALRRCIRVTMPSAATSLSRGWAAETCLCDAPLSLIGGTRCRFTSPQTCRHGTVYFEYDPIGEALARLRECGRRAWSEQTGQMRPRRAEGATLSVAAGLRSSGTLLPEGVEDCRWWTDVHRARAADTRRARLTHRCLDVGGRLSERVRRPRCNGRPSSRRPSA